MAPRLAQTSCLQATLKMSKIGKILIGGFEIGVTWWQDTEECLDQFLLIYVNNYRSREFLNLALLERNKEATLKIKKFMKILIGGSEIFVTC